MLRAFTNPTAAAALASAADAGDQLLWLKAGDRIPCTIVSIDERGVTFKTTLVESTFVPHRAVKAWDAVAGSKPRDVTPDKQMMNMDAYRGGQPGNMIASLTRSVIFDCSPCRACSAKIRRRTSSKQRTAISSAAGSWR